MTAAPYLSFHGKCESPLVQLARCAPSPLVGEGWGGGGAGEHRGPTSGPPPLTPPHKGEGNRPSLLRRCWLTITVASLTTAAITHPSSAFILSWLICFIS